MDSFRMVREFVRVSRLEEGVATNGFSRAADNFGSNRVFPFSLYCAALRFHGCSLILFKKEEVEPNVFLSTYGVYSYSSVK